MARNVLKKDFNSLFDDNSFEEEESVQTVRVSDIEPDRTQPRKNFDIEALKNLAQSIKLNGLIQPLLVRPTPDGKYLIVAGERRWRACKMAGITEVPVFVRELTDKQAHQMMLIENLQRENLNPIEEANGYKELMDNYSMSQEQVAEAVGKARSSIANALRLLTLPKAVKELVEKNELSVGHCKVLLGLKDKRKLVDLAYRAANNEVSVREIERMVKNADRPEKEEKPKDHFYTETEIALSKALETQVKIIPGKKKSTIEIEFYTKEDLIDIANRLAK